MPMEIHKEQIKLNEVICSEYGQTTVESDIIVPDINPDILKVLKTNACACITQKSIQQGRVYIRGIVRINLLYLPEDNLSGELKCINSVLDFSHIINVPEAKEGMILCAEAECESVEENLINSRKINIKCLLGINVKIISPKKIEAAVSADETSGLEVKRKNFEVISTTPDYDFEFVLKERLSFPQGKPDSCEILRADSALFTNELKISDKKAALSGEAKLSVLYRGKNETGSAEVIECAQYSLPFTETPVGEEFKEGMEGEVDYSVKSIICTAEPQSEGEEDALYAEITVCACIRAFKTEKLCVLSDVFAKEFNVDAERKAFDIESFLGNGYIQIPQKEIMELPPYLPEISKVCDISAVPVVSGVEISDGKVIVKGRVCVNALYITDSADLPVAGFEQSFEFLHSFEILGIKDGAICEAKVTPEHISYTLSGDRSLALRIITSLSLKCMVLEKTMLIENVEKSSDPLPKQSPVTIYFAQQGDTLWDVAKKYHISEEKLKEDNECIENDALKCGDIIKIFR